MEHPALAGSRAGSPDVWLKRSIFPGCVGSRHVYMFLCENPAVTEDRDPRPAAPTPQMFLPVHGRVAAVDVIVVIVSQISAFLSISSLRLRLVGISIIRVSVT